MTSELKPCPCCGSIFTGVRWIGSHIVPETAYEYGYRGECPDCGLITRACETEEEAAAAWNTRNERTCTVRQNVPSVEGEDGFGTCDIVDKCSECGEIFYVHPWRGRVFPNYCPNCGCKVVKDSD